MPNGVCMLKRPNIVITVGRVGLGKLLNILE